MEQGNGNRFWDYPFGNQIWRLRSGTWQLFSSYRKDPSGRDIHFFSGAVPDLFIDSPAIMP
jgi:hypothetical protein